MSGSLLTKVIVCIGTVAGWLSNGSAFGASAGTNQSASEADLAGFAVEKQALVKRLSERHKVLVAPIVWTFFDTLKKGDWETASNYFVRIEVATGRLGGRGMIPLAIWGPIQETFAAYDQFHSWNPQLLRRFTETIMQTVPAGSIYFGGTDPGRFAVSALSASHSEGRPFFTLTQNALADGTYLDYLRDIYGEKIYVPRTNDSERVFQEYVSDAEERMKSNQLKEEESVKLVDNRVQVSGVVSVMAINELLVRLIIDKNPTRQIYLEESYPLESLYSQSLPQGLIFKVNHEPLEKLPRSVVEADHRFWRNECRTLIGKVIQDEAGISELCSWTERVYLQQKPEGQGADASYLRDAVAQQYWSQCRSAIAAYYEWWGKKSEKIDSVRLTKEADFAHRQAVALSPYHPAVVWRYAQFLLKNQRTNDAKLLIETTLKTEPEKRMQIDSDQLKKAMNKLRSEAKRL